ncbi:hypothetical protein N0V88_003255 [Collariella sp. IMI 366227]|nr:hypothetical protein N0V88_003255 [Collariella sp. IMI 366227]
MVSSALSLRAVALAALCLVAGVDARNVRRRGPCHPPASATSTSTSEVLPTSTSTSISSEFSTIESSTTEVPPPTTTTSSIITLPPVCEPKSTYYPERCMLQIPAYCTSLSMLDLPYPYGAQDASICQEQLKQQGTVMPEATHCFADRDAKTFSARSAYSCLSSAMVCTFTSTCVDPAATATATPEAVVANPGFESPALGWELGPNHSAPKATNALIGISKEMSHSGGQSLKFHYLAQEHVEVEYIQRGIKLYPGVDYELSWWWQSNNNQAETNMFFRLDFFDYVESGWLASSVVTWNPPNQPVGKWTQQVYQFPARGSYVTLAMGFRGAVGKKIQNIMFIDDIDIKRIQIE